MAYATGTTTETMTVYLTDLGRKRILEQGFNPVSFSLSDDDVNYIADNENLVQLVPDLTGDHNDEVLSLSKNYIIRANIIRNDNLTNSVVIPVNVTGTTIDPTTTNNTNSGI